MPTTELQFLAVDAASDEAVALVAAMRSEIDELYSDRPRSINSVSATPAEMSAPHGAFLLVVAAGRTVGCGGLKRLGSDTCEIKRMYLLPECRGWGLSAPLLEALEQQARELGYRLARLDTGDRQAAAKRLYEGAGYRPIADYNGNTVARFWFEKEL